MVSGESLLAGIPMATLEDVEWPERVEPRHSRSAPVRLTEVGVQLSNFAANLKACPGTHLSSSGTAL
jgi:hypothetical protein